MWRFIQISDPHLGSTVDGRWNNAFLCTMMPDVMLCLKKDLAKLNPDFILLTGDIASQQTRDAMFAARDLMDSLGIPYYPMGGNHDFVYPDSRDWFLEAFHAHLPQPRTYYSFDHKGLHFTVLDAWWKWSDDSISQISERSVAERQQRDLKGARWELPEDQLAWLEQDLAKHKKMPTIVSCHYPAIPIPDRLIQPDMQDAGHLENGPDLEAVLHQFPSVKAMFVGHVHMNYIERRNGVFHIATGALPEYPTEYRDVNVYPDRLEVYTKGLSDTSFANRSLIPGKEWTMGQEQDRKAIIPLK